jgi:hypothetical protein
MLDVQVIDDPAAATVALGPTRSGLLAELVEPASAATFATRVGLDRQHGSSARWVTSFVVQQRRAHAWRPWVDTEVRFRSPADRAAFSSELPEAITKLVSKYDDASAPGGRAHRLVVVAHPLPQKPDPREPS